MWLLLSFACRTPSASHDTEATDESHDFEVVDPADVSDTDADDAADTDANGDTEPAPELGCTMSLDAEGGPIEAFNLSREPRMGFSVPLYVQCTGFTHAEIHVLWTLGEVQLADVVYYHVLRPDGTTNMFLQVQVFETECWSGDATLDVTVNAVFEAASVEAAHLVATAPLHWLESSYEDGDGIPGICDNCDDTPNAEQSDLDLDGIGDACDACPNVADVNNRDADSDGVGDSCDSCPYAPNPLQGVDADADGVEDACDLCPAEVDPAQADADADGFGDRCDNCPRDRNVNQRDADGDGRGDVCDAP